jgi:arylformamidase
MMRDLRPETAKPRPIYRGMDRAALDDAYNNTAAVADSAEWIARWTDASAQVRRNAAARLDIAYGMRARARLDYLPCQANRAPLFVFIHGGYWQRNDKDMFTCMAEGPLARGFDVALPGYTLGPEARLRDIVGEIIQALTFLSERASEFGFDPAVIPHSRAVFRSAAFLISSRSRSIISMRSSIWIIPKSPS